MSHPLPFLVLLLAVLVTQVNAYDVRGDASSFPSEALMASSLSPAVESEIDPVVFHETQQVKSKTSIIE